MTIRFSVLVDAKMAFALALWDAGGRRCVCCGDPVASPEFAAETPYKLAPTIEHVFPKNPAAAALRVISRLRPMAGHGVKAIAHLSCNQAKGNRAPTACEVLGLMAVNVRLPLARRLRALGPR